MKMKVKALIICLLAVSATVLASAGCSHEEQPVATYSDPLTPRVSKIDMPFQIEKDETGWHISDYVICFSDETRFIAANMYNNVTTAYEIIKPEVRTDSIYVIDYENPENYIEYKVNSREWIYSAVPYKDGIIYAQSAGMEETIYVSSQGDTYGYEWKLIYFDGREEKTIDRGYGLNSSATEIILVNGVPVYKCERIKGGKIETSINRITEFETAVIDSMEGFQTRDLLESDGEKYFINLIDEEQTKHVFAVGDEKKIIMEYETKEATSSSSMAGNYVVASYGGEIGKTSIAGISIDGAEEKRIAQTKRWWRMIGSGGQYCMTVDDGFNLYYIDIEEEKVGQVLIPDEMKYLLVDSTSVEGEKEYISSIKSFYPAGKNKFLTEINMEEFYIMDFN